MLVIDCDAWAAPKPFGISGCMRVRNEREMMTAAVISHLPYVDEMVIITQPSEDDTEEIAAHLAQQYDKVRVAHYPLVVDWIDTPGFYEKDPEEPGHLVHMSNWALSQCRYSWIMKTEGDVIALPQLQDIIDAIHAEPDKEFYYGRLLVNLAGWNCDKLSQPHPRNGGFDVAVFNNNPQLFHFERVAKWESIPTTPAQRRCMGWSGLHLKRCRARYAEGWDGEQWIDYTPQNLEDALDYYNKKHGWPGGNDPLGADYLFNGYSFEINRQTLPTEAKI